MRERERERERGGSEGVRVRMCVCACMHAFHDPFLKPECHYARHCRMPASVRILVCACARACVNACACTCVRMKIEIAQLKIETPESVFHENKGKSMAELEEQAGERLAGMRMTDSRSIEDKCLKQFKVESNMKKQNENLAHSSLRVACFCACEPALSSMRCCDIPDMCTHTT